MQPIHRLKIDTSLERAYKALDNVINYEAQSFNEVASLKELDMEHVKHVRNELKHAFEYALTLKNKW